MILAEEEGGKRGVTSDESIADADKVDISVPPSGKDDQVRCILLLSIGIGS